MTIGNRSAISNYVDLVVCCEEAAAEFRPIAAAQGVALGFETETPGYEIVGDAALVHSAIANMVRNALSFTPAGGRVDIRMAGDGRLSVRDTGPGIAHANPEALFEPFVRSPPKRDGYGLGLAIVKAIAGLHGGEVEAANAAGGGAIFSIIFPLQE
jgi:signal transduction histidine kinase